MAGCTLSNRTTSLRIAFELVMSKGAGTYDGCIWDSIAAGVEPKTETECGEKSERDDAGENVERLEDWVFTSWCCACERICCDGGGDDGKDKVFGFINFKSRETSCNSKITSNVHGINFADFKKTTH